MKILSIHAENFASYETLDFNFDSQGLTLIGGPTGSGKSTLCDLVPWTLFGITAKGGKADEVLSWNGGETFSTVTLGIKGEQVQVTRTRKPNDLYFRADSNTDANPTRGKDLQDTQKLINNLLGMNADLYLAGAYYHEFSQTAQFFTTTAKTRREITENLVDLSLPTILQDKIKIEAKDIRFKLDSIESDLKQLNYKANTTQKLLTYTKDLAEGWSLSTSDKISQLIEKSDTFKVTKRHKINALEKEMGGIGSTEDDSVFTGAIVARKQPISERCSECGGVSEERTEYNAWLSEMKQAQIDNSRRAREKVSLRKRMQELIDEENTYLERIQDLKTQVNPHNATILKLNKDLSAVLEEIKQTESLASSFNDKALNLELLTDAVTTLRAELIRTTIEDLEFSTNQLLRDHFDGEITVGFTITDSDKLDVTIQKDSNEAAYTQLSKGQRAMLKLCFGVSVMNTIQQHHSLDFTQLYFDEALDGLDDNNKMKAVKLLEKVALQRDSVYIVEHSETVKALVDQKITIEAINGISRLQV